MGYAFQADSRQHFVAPCSFSGRPEDRTQRGSVISRTWAPALDDRMWIVVANDIPRFRSSTLRGQVARCKSRAPRGRTENLLVPNQVCSHLHLCPMSLFHSVRTVGFETTISSSPNWRDNQASLRSELSCRQYPVGESNPYLRIESPLSYAVRRTGRVENSC